MYLGVKTRTQHIRKFNFPAKNKTHMALVETRKMGVILVPGSFLEIVTTYLQKIFSIV